MPDIPFADFGLKWFKDIVGQIIDWFTEQLTDGYRDLTNGFFGTPLPDGDGTQVVFQPPAPSDAPWHAIYEATVAGEMMVFGLVILFLGVQARHFARVFNIGSTYEARRATRSAWLGAVLIVAWYWLGVLTLYVVQALTIGLIPDISALASALVDLLPGTLANPLLTLAMAALGGLAMTLLKAVYFIREVLLYVYLFGMPIGLGLAFGKVPVVSRIAARLAKRFLPLAILPIPAAVLFRGYAVLFAGDTLAVDPATAFLEYLVVISLPVLALVVSWKTFRYASPLTTRVVEGTARTAATVGAAAGAAYYGSSRAAVTAARRGPRAGAMEAGIRRLADDQDQQSAQGGTNQDRIADDGAGGASAYRRRENDPSYY